VYGRGHRRIAFIHGEHTAVTENRLTGFYRAGEELGLDIPEEYIREGVFHNPDRCAELTNELLSLPEPPTCILMPDDFSALGGLNAIRRRGLRIPEDISAAGYDGIQLASVMSPALTTYRQDTAALGKTAAAKLIELIEKPRTALVDRILIPGRMAEGGSVRDI
jgi:LacI family transcriptional regulator